MFEELMRRIWRRQAEFAFDCARCEDPYRLDHILEAHKQRMEAFDSEVKQMVKELEEA